MEENIPEMFGIKFWTKDWNEKKVDKVYDREHWGLTEIRQGTIILFLFVYFFIIFGELGSYENISTLECDP